MNNHITANQSGCPIIFVSNYFPKGTKFDVIITNVGFFCRKHFIPIVVNYIEKLKSIATIVIWRTTTYLQDERELRFAPDRYSYNMHKFTNI